MKSLSTPSPELPKSIRKLDNKGFSLLEVIVALAIMAIGYMTVFNLFSVSINAVGISDQYQRAVGLANSKLSEIEMLNYETAATSGTFENEENFEWSLNIEPYESPLNDPDKNINLSKVTLKVLWEDNQKPRQVELVTLKFCHAKAVPVDFAQGLAHSRIVWSFFLSVPELPQRAFDRDISPSLLIFNGVFTVPEGSLFGKLRPGLHSERVK